MMPLRLNTQTLTKANSNELYLGLYINCFFFFFFFFFFYSLILLLLLFFLVVKGSHVFVLGFLLRFIFVKGKAPRSIFLYILVLLFFLFFFFFFLILFMAIINFV